ncbi:MAG: hypothetical protein Q4B12_06420 [Bowdeniella nasicola]|nr:hypothetical protein [Bowdeniella nasicola]
MSSYREICELSKKLKVHFGVLTHLLIAESASRTAPQELPGWQVWRRKDYGDTAVVWWELASA